ncbi:hypothetical protein SAY86_002835 [Trapa natans]|uniref:Uncharacterized protein n=1 Tax=Trapa natans TaxID=22666 RepID=A0AAN7LGQ7_TRANT|nr:hypothetical protein SAY86_002835 [Trapa natans]
MRFVLCKFHCPSFICFCNSSPHINTPGSLKPENAPHNPSTAVSDSSESSDKLPAEVKNETSDENPEQSQIDADICIKSTLKKKEPKEAKEAKEKKKKKVQWMDFTGKDLVEIKEFDSWWVNSSSC